MITSADKTISLDPIKIAVGNKASHVRKNHRVFTSGVGIYNDQEETTTMKEDVRKFLQTGVRLPEKPFDDELAHAM